jgi:hypothetical protein
MIMHTYGSAAIADLLGDNVAYRSLRPADSRLPGLTAFHTGTVPRKGDLAYAEVVVQILQAAQQLAHPHVALRKFVVIGDTQRSDGGAFETICTASGWRGRCFICDENPTEPPTIRQQGMIQYANAWQGLHAFQAALEAEEFSIDPGTVIVLDIDKTLLGAKGRNHQLIDRARLSALRAAVAETLGAEFDAEHFSAIYRELDQARYHPITEDNQDLVAYFCVMIGGGVLTISELMQLLQDGYRFRDTLDLASDRVARLNPHLAAFHHDIANLVRAGDPTPYKSFRRREYHETCALLGCSTAVAPEQLLAEEITITAEVWQVAQIWAQQGALLFGLSDKPDEAALPDPALTLAGMLPLHRIPTHIVGI